MQAVSSISLWPVKDNQHLQQCLLCVCGKVLVGGCRGGLCVRCSGSAVPVSGGSVMYPLQDTAEPISHDSASL